MRRPMSPARSSWPPTSCPSRRCRRSPRRSPTPSCTHGRDQPVPGQRRAGPGRRRSPSTPAHPETHVVAGNGSVALCQQLVQATAGDGDEVLFGWRSFEAYPIVTQITGATVGAGAGDRRARTGPARDGRRHHPGHPADLRLHPEQPDRHGRPAGRSGRAFLDAVPDDVLVVIDEAYREFDTDPDSPDGLEFALDQAECADPADDVEGLRAGRDPGRLRGRRPARDHRAAQGRDPVRAELGRAGRRRWPRWPPRTSSRPRWQQVIAERERVHR